MDAWVVCPKCKRPVEQMVKFPATDMSQWWGVLCHGEDTQVGITYFFNALYPHEVRNELQKQLNKKWAPPPEPEPEDDDIYGVPV